MSDINDSPYKSRFSQRASGFSNSRDSNHSDFHFFDSHYNDEKYAFEYYMQNNRQTREECDYVAYQNLKYSYSKMSNSNHSDYYGHESSHRAERQYQGDYHAQNKRHTRSDFDHNNYEYYDHNTRHAPENGEFEYISQNKHHSSEYHNRDTRRPERGYQYDYSNHQKRDNYEYKPHLKSKYPFYEDSSSTKSENYDHKRHHNVHQSCHPQMKHFDKPSYYPQCGRRSRSVNRQSTPYANYKSYDKYKCQRKSNSPKLEYNDNSTIYDEKQKFPYYFPIPFVENDYIVDSERWEVNEAAFHEASYEIPTVMNQTTEVSTVTNEFSEISEPTNESIELAAPLNMENVRTIYADKLKLQKQTLRDLHTFEELNRHIREDIRRDHVELAYNDNIKIDPENLRMDINPEKFLLRVDHNLNRIKRIWDLLDTKKQELDLSMEQKTQHLLQTQYPDINNNNNWW